MIKKKAASRTRLHLGSANTSLRKHKHVTYDSQLYYAMMKTEKEVITETEKKGNNEEKR